MTDIRYNKIRNYTKLDHKHHCAVALKSKDFANFIRHYLYLRANFAGEFKYDQTLTASIVRLTKWDAKVITNAIARLKKAGEIERVQANIYRLNPDIANRSGYIVTSKYGGLDPVYTPEQQKLIAELEKETKHTRLTLPQSQEEMDELEAAEEQGIENMVALRKIDELTLEVRDLKAMIAELVQRIITQPEVPAEVKDEVKRHLELVK